MVIFFCAIVKQKKNRVSKGRGIGCVGVILLSLSFFIRKKKKNQIKITACFCSESNRLRGVKKKNEQKKKKANDSALIRLDTQIKGKKKVS